MEGLEQRELGGIMGYGIMRVSIEALAGLLHLPASYKAIAVQQDFAHGDLLHIWFVSDAIPKQPADEHPLEIAPLYTVHINPECPDPEYRKVTCDVEIKHHKRLSLPDTQLQALIDETIAIGGQ